MADFRDLQQLTDKAARHFEAGRYSSAEKFYLRALKGAPKHPQLLFAIASLYEDMSKPLKAIRLYERALQHEPNYYAAALNLGACLIEIGKHGEAERVLRKAVTYQPRPHLAHFNLGNALVNLTHLEEAISEYRKALEIEPSLPDAWFNLGNALRDTDNLDEAIKAYGKAIAHRPEFALAFVNLGIVQQTLAKFNEARQNFEKALDIDPALPAAHYQLSLMGHAMNSLSEGLHQIETCLDEQALTPASQATLHFAAARLRAKMKDYDTAFGHYESANKNCAIDNPFNTDTFTRYIERLMHGYTKRTFEQAPVWANQSEKPVFIVGMPRSGTTLVEQIIASHPKAHGAGERTEIVRFVRENVVPEKLDEIDGDTMKAFTGTYMDAISSHAGGASRITDKMPANFLNLGLIALMFPAAKIIHCRRDPLDTCLSCYFQNFSEGLSFTNDLASLGFYYRGYEKLMDHWRQTLPLEIHEIVYEELVGDIEIKSRDLINHLDLEWDPVCLEFFKTERVVTTASIWQARQPIYSSSIGTWRKYETHIGQLKEALGFVG